jgi:hypothetical protein
VGFKAASKKKLSGFRLSQVPCQCLLQVSHFEIDLWLDFGSICSLVSLGLVFHISNFAGYRYIDQFWLLYKLINLWHK